MMKPDGSEQRKLLQEEKEIASARWAPTEDALYYLRREGETKDLLKLSIPGAPAAPTLLASGLETGDYFTLTADGKQLAYARSLSFSNLWLTEFPIHGATARVQQPITSGTRLHGDPSVSPDGRWVAYVSGSSTIISPTFTKWPSMTARRSN
jgi:Tol biopolymer transport system component